MHDELQKLLESNVTALEAEDLEPILVELVYKQAPAWTFISQAQAETKVHEFNQRTALPVPNFEGEMAVTASSNSQYNRVSTTLKIMRQKGGVTNFAQLSMARFIDAFSTELKGAVKALGWQIEAGVLWANSTADAYQYDGFDTLIQTNVFNWNSLPVSLALLDDMIDASDDAGGQGHKRAFVLGTKIRSSLTRILRDKFHSPELVQMKEGMTIEAYRGIPLLNSTGVRASAQMTTVTAAQTTSGSVPNGTYYYVVAPVTVDGEQQGSAQTSITTTSTNYTVNLSWTAYSGAFLYKIYRGTSPTNVGLIAVIAGNTYDGNGTVNGTVASYSDIYATATPSTTYTPLVSGDQVMFLLDADQDESAEIRYLSERNNLIQYMDLAQISDQKEFLLRTAMALIMKYEKVNAYARKVTPV